MPEGVEHCWRRASTWGASRVPLAVMPEGVEHPSMSSRHSVRAFVPLAVMPEGVEHDSKREDFDGDEAASRSP